MAYGTKYRATEKDQLGRTVQVDFQLDGYAGGATPVRLAKDGLKRRWGAAGAGGAAFGLKPQLRSYRLSARDRLAAEEVASSGVWRTREFVGGSLFGQWEVVREEAERSTNLVPQPAEVSARCGLGRLSELLVAPTYAEAEALFAAGPRPLLWWLLEALARTTHALELDAFVRRVPAGIASALEGVYAQPSRWVQTEYNGTLGPIGDAASYDVKSATWMDVASDVASALGCVLAQQDARWRLVERALFYDGEAEEARYDADAHLTLAPPLVSTAALATLAAPRSLLGGGRGLARDGQSEIHVSYDAGAASTMLPRGGWTLQASAPGFIPAPGRVLVGPGGAYLLGLAASLGDLPPAPAIVSPAVPVADGTALRIAFRVTAAPNSAGDFAFALLWRAVVEADGVTYVLEEETAPFMPPALKWTQKTPTLFDAVTSDLPGGVAVEIDRDLPPAPVGGAIRFEVIACFDDNGALTASGQRAALYAQIEDVALLPASAGAVTYAARVDGFEPDPGGAEKAFVMKLGTGPSAAHPGCLLLASGSAAPLWKPSSASSVAPQRLAELEAYTRLEEQRNVQLELRGAYRQTPAGPALALVDEAGRALQWTEGEADDLKVSIDGTALEVRVDSFTINVVQIQSQKQGSFGGGTGDIATTLARVIESQDAQLARIAQQNALTATTAWHGPGVITTLQVDPIETPQEALRAGRKILVVDRRSGTPRTFTLAQRQTSGADELYVEAFDLGADGYVAPGSGVYPVTEELLNIQTYTAEATYNLIRADALCELTADTAGTATALSVTPLREDIADGTLLTVQRLTRPGPKDVELSNGFGEGGGSTVECYADGLHYKGAEVLEVRMGPAPGSGGVAIDAAEGAVVKVSGVQRQSESIQTAYEITQRVRKDEIVSEMTVQFDRITFDTYRVCSENWDGTISVTSGLATITDPGTVGWCITNSGQAVFNSVQTVGYVKARDLLAPYLFVDKTLPVGVGMSLVQTGAGRFLPAGAPATVLGENAAILDETATGATLRYVGPLAADDATLRVSASGVYVLRGGTEYRVLDTSGEAQAKHTTDQGVPADHVGLVGTVPGSTHYADSPSNQADTGLWILSAVGWKGPVAV